MDRIETEQGQDGQRIRDMDKTEIGYGQNGERIRIRWRQDVDRMEIG